MSWREEVLIRGADNSATTRRQRAAGWFLRAIEPIFLRVEAAVFSRAKMHAYTCNDAQLHSKMNTDAVFSGCSLAKRFFAAGLSGNGGMHSTIAASP
ncbi:hypothetical protein [Oryzisolibacter propanilivorax]|uniref:hypothetical protein n=1 Tax=Oryzisolibacter propanilivorax TaxID=1527607 RepID=UPI001C316F22|nr:hypothetical protein [Oryzisolibacter propanilivorax]